MVTQQRDDEDVRRRTVWTKRKKKTLKYLVRSVTSSPYSNKCCMQRKILTLQKDDEEVRSKTVSKRKKK